MIPIWIDTDVGTDVDDALALALAAASPEVELVAVTTVDGDTSLRARIARKILALAGRDEVPVAAGCGPSLLRASPGSHWGHEGQGILEGNNDGTPYSSEHAVDLLVDKIQEAACSLTIVAIGPVTNIALAIIKEPWIRQHIERLVIMGGCMRPDRVGRGEIELPEHVAARLEHNLNADMEAAEVVFRSGVPLTLVPVEVTSGIWLTGEDRSALRRIGSRLADTLSVAIDIWDSALRVSSEARGLPGSLARPYLHDPLALAVAIDGLFAHVEPMHVRLERREGVLRTVADPGAPPNVQVVTAADGAAFRAFLLKRLGVR